MSFLALVIALSAIPFAQQLERADGAFSLPFLRQEQEIRNGPLLYSLIMHSQYPLLRVTGWGNTGMIEATTLLERLLPGTRIQIAGRLYGVQSIDVTNSGWAGISTWEDFLAPPVGRLFRFHFGTPLVIQAPGSPGASSFPTPPLFFGNLAQRWQALGGPALPSDEVHLATWLQGGGCIVADYRLQGQPVVLSPACRSLGFLGHVTYRCREEAPVEQQMLTALARFAFFAGSGLAVARGLGATRVAVDP